MDGASPFLTARVSAQRPLFALELIIAAASSCGTQREATFKRLGWRVVVLLQGVVVLQWCSGKALHRCAGCLQKIANDVLVSVDHRAHEC